MAFESILNLTANSSASLMSNSAGSFDFDLVTIEQHASKLRLTENPIEGGASVADHAVLEPKEITINGLVVGYTPAKRPLSNLISSNGLIDYVLPIEIKSITAQAEQAVKSIQSAYEAVSNTANKVIADFLPDYSIPAFDSSSSDRIAGAYEQLLLLQRSGEPLTLQTSTRQYKNMMIVSIQMNQQTKMTGEFSIVLREIFIVETKIANGLKASSGKRQNLGKTQPKENHTSALKAIMKG
ncbi:MAG: hypothetical protein [Bacteriophage sp.]|nr:MAG: hypothetical protein [Bacteriophage sp.]